MSPDAIANVLRVKYSFGLSMSLEMTVVKRNSRVPVVASVQEPLMQTITKDGSRHKDERQLLLECEGEFAKLYKGRDGVLIRDL